VYAHYLLVAKRVASPKNTILNKPSIWWFKATNRRICWLWRL